VNNNISDNFVTFEKLNQIIKNKNIIFFGSGLILEKTTKYISLDKVEFIFDNNPNLWGSDFLGKKILNPFDLKKFFKNHIILISTTSFNEVVDQLNKMKFIYGKDFFLCPLLNDRAIITQIDQVKKKILISSGLPSSKEPLKGGGIYEIDFNSKRTNVKKVISGNTYGLIKVKNFFVATDDTNGIIFFDNDYKIIKKSKFKIGTRAHGVSYSEKYNKYYVISSQQDAVVIFDKNLDYERTIFVSEKFKKHKSPQHHCNDIFVNDFSGYISMFSISGNFKHDIFDGGVVEFDLLTNNIIGPVKQNLWMPHNISYHNGSMLVLDSLRGNLLTNNFQIVGSFPGFTRGLDFDGSYYFVGQSRNRNYSKYLGISNNVSLDTSIIIFDPVTKVSKSIFLPNSISEIHSILLL